jgi:hypothetical protein
MRESQPAFQRRRSVAAESRRRREAVEVVDVEELLTAPPTSYIVKEHIKKGTPVSRGSR